MNLVGFFLIQLIRQLLPNWPHLTYIVIEDRMDVILGKLMQSQIHLWEAVKLFLIFSHVNAHVESGFLTNEQISDDNMKETSLAAQRIAYEGIQSEGGVLKEDINKKFLSYVQGAHAEYSHVLEGNKKTQTAGEKRKQERHRLNNKLKNAKRAKTECITAPKHKHTF